jgi:FkbM family methyltransferase
MRKYSYYFTSIFRLLFGFREPLRIILVFLGLRQSGIHPVSLRNPRLRFNLRSKLDIWTVKETFLDKFYTRYGTEIQPGWTVVDVGAGVGDFSIYAALTPKTRVLGYEPHPQSFLLFKLHLVENNIENVSPYNLALSAKSGTIALDTSGDDPLQFPGLPIQTTPTDSIQIQSTTLLDVLRDNQLKTIDLLKLDCEGAEYDILLTAAPETLARVKRIVMETHNTDAHTAAELVDFLHGQGYRVQTWPNAVHPHLGYLYAQR